MQGMQATARVQRCMWNSGQWRGRGGHDKFVACPEACNINIRLHYEVGVALWQSRKGSATASGGLGPGVLLAATHTHTHTHTHTLTGVAFKEGFCYRKWEAAGLALCVPTLLLGHLTQLVPVEVCVMYLSSQQAVA